METFSVLVFVAIYLFTHFSHKNIYFQKTPGPGFQVEFETRFAAQAQKPWGWIIDMSELEQQILSQAPLGNRAQASPP